MGKSLGTNAVVNAASYLDFNSGLYILFLVVSSVFVFFRFSKVSVILCCV